MHCRRRVIQLTKFHVYYDIMFTKRSRLKNKYAVVIESCHLADMEEETMKKHK